MNWNLVKKIAVWHLVLTIALVNLANYFALQSYVANSSLSVWGRLATAIERALEFPITLFVYRTSAGDFIAVLFTGVFVYLIYGLNSLFMGWVIVYLKELVQKYRGLPNY